MKVTSIILAGGKNRRLGRNKALEAIQGRSVLEHVMEQIKPIASQILIVTSENYNGTSLVQIDILASYSKGSFLCCPTF